MTVAGDPTEGREDWSEYSLTLNFTSTGVMAASEISPEPESDGQFPDLLSQILFFQ